MNDRYNKIIASRAGYTYPEMHHADDDDAAIRTSDENIADWQAQVASQRLCDLEIMSEAQANNEDFNDNDEDANIFGRKNAGR